MQFVRTARIKNPQLRMQEVRKGSTAVVAIDPD
jgi:hypothetical protein